jgi:ubiquinone/menaquinone biosynthesis C-methylase UbiE
MPTVEDVRDYWQRNPLLSYELAEPASPAFFDALDRIKREDVESYALAYWDFEAFRGRSVLDVGCGPGWLTVQYAAAGAHVTAIDLTPRAVELTRQHLAYRNLSATVAEGNAEQLQFSDDSFDLVASSGVLHHTPDTPRAIRECYRVLKPGGAGKLTFYHKGILHSRCLFPLTRLVMRLIGVKHPGADLAKTATSADDFIRQYDGAANPVGIGHTTRQWRRLLEDAGFVVVGHEKHFFPRCFIPSRHLVPRLAHYVLDRWFGTMIYFELRKPSAQHN